MPLTYNMMEFVWTMNTACNIALKAMAVRGGGQRGSIGGNCNNDAGAQLNVRIAIADLALKKVLNVHEHVRNGSRGKQQTEEVTASGLARKR